MNTIWLKIAGVAVVLVVALVVGSKYMSGDEPAGAPQSDSSEADKPRTVYDSFERDDNEFGVDAQATDEPAEAAPPVAVETPTQEIVAPQPTPPAAPAQPTFEKLSIEDDIQAQRFHSMALQERKRSRLPMMTPKLMVDYCRQIIQKWPKSEYAFQAKRMLADIPERHKKRYNVTDQEMDVSSFYQ